MIMELPAFAVILAIVAVNAGTVGPVVLTLLALWEAHYVYRVFVYPFLLTSPGKQFPVLIVGFALAFNVLNGATNGLGLVNQSGLHDSRWLLDPRFIVGVVIFVAGFALHASSDRHLRILRKSGGSEYRIPSLWPFRLVSCPNYLGEILEWCGWAVATWSLGGLAFALFTIANLAPRALTNHRWYRATFAEYPRQRHALAPWVW